MSCSAQVWCRSTAAPHPYRTGQFANYTDDPDWIEDERSFFVSTRPYVGRRFLLGRCRWRLSDTAPENWGWRLLEQARGTGPSGFEYLTLLDDTCRQSILRFLDEDGEVARLPAKAVPRLVDLTAITQIARACDRDRTCPMSNSRPGWRRALGWSTPALQPMMI